MGPNALHLPPPITYLLLSFAEHHQDMAGECCMAHGRLLLPRVHGGNGEHSMFLGPAFLRENQKNILLLASLSAP